MIELGIRQAVWPNLCSKRIIIIISHLLLSIEKIDFYNKKGKSKKTKVAEAQENTFRALLIRINHNK